MTELTALIINSTDLIPKMITEITWKNLVDILIVATIIYLIFLFIKKTRAFLIVNALIIMSVLYYLSMNFDLGLVRQFLQPLLTFMIVIVVVVFQRELRLFIRWIASQTPGSIPKNANASVQTVETICRTVLQMTEKRIGGILVFQGEQSIDDLLESGFHADAKITRQIILSIFDNHTPGHDGAITISDNRITKFGVRLPLAEKREEFKNFGTRHISGIGITEQCDAMSIIVSEEKGTISVAENGDIKQVENIDDLKDIILIFLKENKTNQTSIQSFWTYFILKNWKLKIMAIILSSSLWFFMVFQSGIINQDIKIPIEIKLLPKDLSASSIDQKEITVTISGSQKDLKNFDPKTIGLQIDAKDYQTGKKEIKIEKNMFARPEYIQIQKFYPEKITIDITNTKLE